MKVEVKSSSPVATSKCFFTSWRFSEVFFFISHTIFRCQKEIKNKSLKWTTLVYISTFIKLLLLLYIVQYPSRCIKPLLIYLIHSLIFFSPCILSLVSIQCYFYFISRIKEQSGRCSVLASVGNPLVSFCTECYEGTNENEWQSETPWRRT